MYRSFVGCPWEPMREVCNRMWGRPVAIKPLSIRQASRRPIVHTQIHSLGLWPSLGGPGNLSKVVFRLCLAAARDQSEENIIGRMNGNRFRWVVESVSKVLVLYVHTLLTYLCERHHHQTKPRPGQHTNKYAIGGTLKSPWIIYWFMTIFVTRKTLND